MLTNEFVQRCESIAVQMRHTLHLRGYDPLPHHRLAKHMNVGVICPQDLPDIDATTIERAIASSQWYAIAVLTNPRLIIYHPGRSIVQQSFSIMHELAHIILKHNPEQLGKLSDLYITRQYPKRAEIEADYLAACLQFPAVATHYVRQRAMTPIEIQDYYGISEVVLYQRYQDV
jgi:Zn-dependent peptidase ImmA (M78 family)